MQRVLYKLMIVNRNTHKQIRAVLFDLDDTLYSRENTFKRWAGDYLISLGIDDKNEHAKLMTWLESLDANGYGSKKAVMAALYSRFPQENESIETFYDAFLTKVLDEFDVHSILNDLDAQGLTYGIITNGSSHRQRQKIQALKIENRMQCICISEEMHDRKPNRTIFHKAAEMLNTDPASVLFTGDHPILDICGAHDAGMITTWFHRGRPWPKSHPVNTPDYVIDHLSEVLDIVKMQR